MLTRYDTRFDVAGCGTVRCVDGSVYVVNDEDTSIWQAYGVGIAQVECCAVIADGNFFACTLQTVFQYNLQKQSIVAKYKSGS